MRISDWSSDVCSSDLKGQHKRKKTRPNRFRTRARRGKPRRNRPSRSLRAADRTGRRATPGHSGRPSRCTPSTRNNEAGALCDNEVGKHEDGTSAALFVDAERKSKNQRTVKPTGKASCREKGGTY